MRNATQVTRLLKSKKLSERQAAAAMGYAALVVAAVRSTKSIDYAALRVDGGGAHSGLPRATEASSALTHLRRKLGEIATARLDRFCVLDCPAVRIAVEDNAECRYVTAAISEALDFVANHFAEQKLSSVA